MWAVEAVELAQVESGGSSIRSDSETECWRVTSLAPPDQLLALLSRLLMEKSLWIWSMILDCHTISREDE